MRWNKKYRITLEDEMSLEKKVDFKARFPLLLFLGIIFIIIAGFLGIFILASTPLKNNLPGYLKESERTATEEQQLRLDSLVRVYEINEAYIRAVLEALNPTDTINKKDKETNLIPLSVDSLMQASEVEKEFMETIRERDRFNINYVSPAAAQTLMFGNVNKAGVISQDTKDKYQVEILIPSGSPVTSVAEGKVISVATSPKTSGGYEVIIQHPKGFLSKTGRLLQLTVRPGDKIAPGQIIATGTSKAGMSSNKVTFELWHDGDPLLPSRYLSAVPQF